jgi:hypothetical protein
MRSILTLAALLMLALVMPAHASVANAPGANLQVSLITYGPGETYWERFGHDAIELRDLGSDEAINFNYGVFDFDQRGFLLNFARGRMRYLMDAAPSALDESLYVRDKRSVTRQRLALNAGQAAALRDFLLWNLRPENAAYPYDYYADNCTTRVRDALDAALGGVLRAQLTARPGGMTFRQQTVRLMSAQPWLMLVLDLGLGPYADQPLNAWRESFLPGVLQTQLRGIDLADHTGHPQPLVLDEQLVAPNLLDVPPARAPDLRLPLALAGLLCAGLLILAARLWLPGYLTLGTLYLLASGLVGLLLLVLWTLTTHRSAWANANLLLFNPLAWLLLPSVWRMRRALRPSRFINMVIVVQLFAVLGAVVLHLLPGTVQQNQPWLLFALPVWIAMAWTLRSGRQLKFGAHAK